MNFQFVKQDTNIDRTVRWAVYCGIVNGILLLFMITNSRINDFTPLMVASIFITVGLLVIAHLSNCDYTIIVLSSLLLEIGNAVQALLNNQDTVRIASRELISFAMGVILAYGMRTVLKCLSSTQIMIITGIGCVGLIAVLMVTGTSINGTKAWLTVAGISFQITEIIKIMAVVLFAALFSEKTLSEKKKFFIAIGITVLLGISFTLFREMGTLVVILLIMILFIYAYFESIWYFAGSIITTTALCISGYFVLFLCHEAFLRGIDNRFIVLGNSLWSKMQERISLLVNLEKLDQTGLAFQTITARKAIRLGGWFGSNYDIKVPVADSDFVYVSLIQKMGVLMAIVVIILFVCILITGLRISYTVHEGLTSCMVYGFTMLIFFQSLLTIFGSTNFFILMGLPIAFLSSGGTYLALVFAMVIFISLSTTSTTQYGEQE